MRPALLDWSRLRFSVPPPPAGGFSLLRLCTGSRIACHFSLHKKLIYTYIRRHVSRSASIHSRLPWRRRQLKQHEFFEGIDWLRLSQRHVIPPYLPKVNTYFEPYMYDIPKLKYGLGKRTQSCSLGLVVHPLSFTKTEEPARVTYIHTYSI